MKFKDKVVLITGGSKGIGKSTARAFAEEGAAIAFTYSSDDKAAEETLSLLPGNIHLTIKADIRFAQESKAAVSLVIAKYNRLDILVNSAGVYIPHPLAESGFDEWEDAWKIFASTYPAAAERLLQREEEEKKKESEVK